MLTYRADFGIATAANGKIYVAGGGNDSQTFLQTFEEYDPSLNAWTRRPDMPTARSGLALVATGNGKLYAIGGQACTTCPLLATVEEYDTGTNIWTNCGGSPTTTNCQSMPTPRTELGAAVAGNGKIYAVGGGVPCDCGVPPTNIVEEYDPTTNSWRSRTSMTVAHMGLGVAAGPNGKIYAIGGSGGCGSTCYFSTTEEYDPSTDAWTSRKPMNQPRGYLGATSVDGKIYVIGGAYDVLRLKTVEEYDPLTDAWVIRPDMPTGRSNLQVAASNGRIYAMGGFNVILLGIVEEYTTSSATGPCSPRPRVVVHSARGVAGELRVTLDAGTSAGSPTNQLTQLQIGAATNARITVPAGPNGRPGLTSSPGNATLNLTEAPGSLTFSVIRAQNGQATTVPISVTDACGTWRTFVGGGPTAF